MFLSIRGTVIEIWDPEQFSDAYKRTYTPGTKTAVVYKKEWFYSIVNTVKETKPPKLLPERYMLELSVFQLTPHHFFLNILDRKLQQYIEADLINYNANVRDRLLNDQKKYEVRKESFAVLTFGELQAGFFVCLMPLLLSIIVFGLECFQIMRNLLMIFQLMKIKHSEQSKLNRLTNLRMT